jgi:hypothetical protein
LLGRAGAERRAGGEQLLERGDEPALGEEDVEEARPGDFDVVDALAQGARERPGEALGDLPRRRAQRGRQQHRGVRGVVAEAGLLRPLERRPDGQARLAVAQLGGRRLDRAAELFERTH